MDISSLKDGITLVNVALTTIRQAISIIPDKKKKEEVTRIIEQADREFKEAEIIFAQQMGYKLCRAHFPPEIMLTNDNGLNWECPICHNKVHFLSVY